MTFQYLFRKSTLKKTIIYQIKGKVTFHIYFKFHDFVVVDLVVVDLVVVDFVVVDLLLLICYQRNLFTVQ